MTLSKNASRHGHRSAQQRLGFFEALYLEKGICVVVGFYVMREQRDASGRLKLFARVALNELDLAAIASRSQTLQAENESLAAENGRLRAHVEELDESYEHPRQLDRIEVAQ